MFEKLAKVEMMETEGGCQVIVVDADIIEIIKTLKCGERTHKGEVIFPIDL